MADPVFFAPARPYTVGEIANFAGAELRENGASSDELILRLSSAATAASGSLAFVDGAANRRLLASIAATAVFVTAGFASDVPQGTAVLVCSHPHIAFARTGPLLYPAAARPAAVTGETGVSPSAWVHPGAIVEPGAIIEAGAVIGEGAAIGTGTLIAPNAVVGAHCQIGRDCHIGLGATVQAALIGNRVLIMAGARIGQDGFGYVPGPGGLEKVPHIGRVVIQDDVEIGANTTVDRGALDDTVIGEGTKIDNLVQIAHNVTIGRHCVLAGHVGISGSVSIGDHVMMGGGVGIADHLAIGNGARIAASSGVMNDIPAGQSWGGTPAMPFKEAMRLAAVQRALIWKAQRKDEKPT